MDEADLERRIFHAKPRRTALGLLAWRFSNAGRVVLIGISAWANEACGVSFDNGLTWKVCDCELTFRPNSKTLLPASLLDTSIRILSIASCCDPLVAAASLQGRGSHTPPVREAIRQPSSKEV